MDIKTSRDLFVGVIAEKLVVCTRFQQTKSYIQHGNVSVYQHCLAVAKMSCLIAGLLHLEVEREALIRGALLHDYFLYDWHEENDGQHRLHGFTHPRTAWSNARQDVELNEVEADIILHHMFPLTVIPPTTKEGWIVCMADKLCATQETLRMPFIQFVREWLNKLGITDNVKIGATNGTTKTDLRPMDESHRGGTGCAAGVAVRPAGDRLSAGPSQ